MPVRSLDPPALRRPVPAPRSQLLGERVRPHVLAFGPYLLVLVVRLATMSDALTNDEAGSAVVGRSWLLGQSAGIDPGPYGAYWFDRPPLLPLLYGSADLLGGATGVRLLGLVAALVLVVLVGCIARTIAGERPALVARWIAAPLLVAAPMQADRTYGELLAAVPVAIAVWMLARTCARDTPHVARAGFVAGVAATCAVLVKQSALDALVVAGVLLLAGRLPRRAVVAGLVGCIATLVAAAAWASTTPGGIDAVVHATIGFRIEQFGSTRAHDAAPITGMSRLLLPALLSGLLALAAIALVGLVRLGSWPRILLLAWTLGALLGMLGGGFYWPHYLIQMVPPLAIAAAILLVQVRWQIAPVLVCGILVALAAIGPALRSQVPHTGRYDELARQVGEDVARRAEPDDRILVLTARPGVVHASGLRSVSPWLWSAMIDARSGVQNELVRMLEAESPPRWVVAWDRTQPFDVPHRAHVRALLERRYARVSVHDGRVVWRLRSRREIVSRRAA